MEAAHRPWHASGTQRGCDAVARSPYNVCIYAGVSTKLLCRDERVERTQVAIHSGTAVGTVVRCLSLNIADTGMSGLCTSQYYLHICMLGKLQADFLLNAAAADGVKPASHPVCPRNESSPHRTRALQCNRWRQNFLE